MLDMSPAGNPDQILAHSSSTTPSLMEKEESDSLHRIEGTFPPTVMHHPKSEVGNSNVIDNELDKTFLSSISHSSPSSSPLLLPTPEKSPRANVLSGLHDEDIKYRKRKEKENVRIDRNKNEEENIYIDSISEVDHFDIGGNEKISGISDLDFFNSQQQEKENIETTTSQDSTFKILKPDDLNSKEIESNDSEYDHSSKK